jgi:hypothetical protein
MPRRISLSRQLTLLEERRSQLRGEIKQLAKAQRALLLRHSLLKAWCESLQLMQVVRAPKLLLDAAPDEPIDRLDDLVQREVSLLETLTASSSGATDSMPAAAEALHPGIPTIAPVTDPMAYFRWAAAGTARPHEPMFLRSSCKNSRQLCGHAPCTYAIRADPVARL